MSTGVQLYTHPEYKRMVPHYEMWRDLYEGDHSTLVKKYLWYHGLEKKADDDATQLRRAREERTRYLNFIEIMVSLWTSIFFKEDPIADKATLAMLGDDINNVDGYGTSLNTFVKNHVLRSVLIYGPAYVLADAFPMAARTQAEARAQGARPYLELIQPLDVKDWHVENANSARFGRFNMLRREFDVMAPRLSSRDIVRMQRVSHEMTVQDGRYQTQVYYSELDDAGVPVEKDPKTGEAAFQVGDVIRGDLPEIPLSYMPGESWIKDVAQETLRHFNLRSNYDNINYFQGYQKIFIKGVDGTDDNERKAMSAYVISFLKRPDADVIFGEPVNTGSLENALSESVSNIFKVGLNQLRMIAADSRAPQAADAQSQEREHTNALVVSTLEEIETLINSALKDYAAFKGQPNFTGKYELNKEVEQEDFDQWVSVYTAFKDELSRNYPEVNKQAVKKAVQKLSLGNEEKILQMIDDAEPAPDTAQADEERQNLFSQLLNG